MRRILYVLFFLAPSFLFADPISLHIVQRQTTICGKETTILEIVQPDGTRGLTAVKGTSFEVQLYNDLNVPTSVHWHGILLPSQQDGVAFITQFPIFPGQSYLYQFPILQSGTFFMHSHFGLQEQRLMAAPLILLDSEESTYHDRDVVIMLTDFSFLSPQEIYRQLKEGDRKMALQQTDLIEVHYDAFLANWRTLDDPEIILVSPGTKIRLRIINSASATEFFLFLGKLKGEVISVDGNSIKPFKGTQFELGIAQRMDITVSIPKEGGAFPILAQGQGTSLQTGIVLATSGAKLPKFKMKAAQKIGALTNAQEMKLHALNPLSKRTVDQHFTVELNGNMKEYIWTLNGQVWPYITPLVVNEGARVEILFKNLSAMTHPMHLHGHTFQVTAINGTPVEGAKRDTVLVTPHSSVTIQFDADHPGVWPLHCHIPYHIEAGMITILRYQDYIQPLAPILRLE